MRAGPPLLLALLLLVPQAPSGAQDAAEAADPAGPANPTGAPDSLLDETRSLDIQTAGYYELLAWVRDLGLDDTGGRAALQQRLFDHYGLRPERELTDAQKKRSLQVEAAREAEYFTIEEVEEKYVVLRGGVRVELREGEVLHSIQAEEITLNQTENILTAEGGVEYTMRQGERTESFRGESLTFNTRTLEGVFFRGGTGMDQRVEGGTVTFRFTGDSISRLENNTVVLENARVTTSTAEDPYYHIRARKLWVLDSGDWAVRNALLYIGRVPMVYLPFFFYPGDQFFFHPVIGTRLREGSFLQTTTYLLGQKPRRQTPFSILQLEEVQEEQTRLRRQGLFLSEAEGETLAPGSLERFLKVMVDMYSKLGAFAGVSGNFPPQVGFQGGFGLSRSLFAQGGGYTPYWPNSLGVYQSWWNEALLFGLPLPFRYGLDLRWNLEASMFRFSGVFELYSDPSFPRDFFDRLEEIDWTGVLGLEAGSTRLVPPTEKLNLTWELTTRAELGGLVDSPLLQTFSVPYFQARMFWQSRLLEGLSLPGSEVLAADPGSRFYFPVSLQFPNVSLNLAGEIYRYSSRERENERREAARSPAAAAEPQPAAGTGEYRLSVPPAGEADPGGSPDLPAETVPDSTEGAAVAVETVTSAAEEATSEVEEATAEVETAPAPEPAVEEFRLPGPQPDLPVQREREALSFRLGYQFRPDLIVEQTFDSAGWKTPADVDYSVLYTTTRLTDTASLNYQLNVLEQFLGIGGGLTFLGTYRDRDRGTASDETAWQALVLGDHRQSRIDLSTQFNAGLRPLLDVPGFGGSRLTYALNWVYYSYRLSETESTWDSPVYRGFGLDWTPETVRSHQAQALLEYRPLDIAHTLSLTADLPPRPGSLNGRLQFTVWLLTTTVNTVLREDGGRWELQPLVIQETLKLGEDLTLSDELRFDLAEGLLTRNTVALAAGGWKASLSAERLPPVEFDPGDGSWDEIPGAEERLQLTQLSIGYDLTPEPLWFWKDRIRLEANLHTAWAFDFREFTENSLDFIFSFRFHIHRFLELSFTSVSFNNQTYRYFPSLAEKIGETPVNPVVDLLRSFNFFNPEDRYQSAFKLRSISVEAVHHLDDWDLVMTYEGKPTLFNQAGQLEYRWENTLIILLKWIPLPQVRSRMWMDSTGFYVRS